jgi:hypothetical protein
MNKNLEQALEYYKLGFSVIPLIPKTKRETVNWEHSDNSNSGIY